MKNFLATLTILSIFLPAIAQEPSKLCVDQGFNGIRIDAPLQSVRKYFLKDSISKKEAWDSTEVLLDYNNKIFLVDLKQPGFGEFNGYQVERIEVYVGKTENWLIKEIDSTTEIVKQIVIYIQKIDTEYFQDFIGSLIGTYGTSYGENLDYGQQGDAEYTWTCAPYTLIAANYYGSGNFRRDHAVVTIYDRGW